MIARNLAEAEWNCGAVAGGPAPLRTFSPQLFNQIANEPEVRPWLGGKGEISVGELLKDSRNFAFQLGEFGGFLGLWKTPGLYEVHTIFRPGQTPHSALLEFAEDCLEYMFCKTDCTELMTLVPEGNLGAEWLSQKMRFQEVGRRENWSGAGGSVAVKCLKIDEWARSSMRTANSGKAFHMEVEKLRKQGQMLEEHSAAPADHDSAAGAALLMAKSGQAQKAAGFYNRWAALAGFPPIRLVSLAPLLVDCGAGVLAWEENGRLVVGCQ